MELFLKREGDVLIISFEGRLILSELEKPRKFVKECIENEKNVNIIFDLSKVDFIDSAGLGFIVAIFKSLKMRNGKFAISGLKQKQRELFSFTRLNKIIPIYSNVEMAKQEL